MKQTLALEDYQLLAEFRHQIRRYLRFSDAAVRTAGLEPRQYQLLLALKGLPAQVRPRIGELAEQLQIQHHSAVELVDRLAAGGLVKRQRGTKDRREVHVLLTTGGERVLRELVLHHRSDLSQNGPALIETLRRVLQDTKKGRNHTKRKP
jgi:DNA-binding MarR family transcriptional regulator